MKLGRKIEQPGLNRTQTDDKSTLRAPLMFASLTNNVANIFVISKSPFNQRTLYGDIPCKGVSPYIVPPQSRAFFMP